MNLKDVQNTQKTTKIYWINKWSTYKKENNSSGRIKQFCVVIITQGGGVAAPVGGQIFSEILPYLEVSQGNEDEVEKIEQVQTPDILGKTIKEAEKILKESGLEISIKNNEENIDKENTIIKNQIPKAGIIVNQGNNIYIEY